MLLEKGSQKERSFASSFLFTLCQWVLWLTCPVLHWPLTSDRGTVLVKSSIYCLAVKSLPFGWETLNRMWQKSEGIFSHRGELSKTTLAFLVVQIKGTRRKMALFFAHKPLWQSLFSLSRDIKHALFSRSPLRSVFKRHIILPVKHLQRGKWLVLEP